MQHIINWLEARLSRSKSAEHSVTVPNLKLDDQSSPDIDKSTGFNPYDTARLHKK